jgi:hypothetical protein
MPIDAGIYGQFAEPARSTADYQAQYDSQAQRQMQLQQNRLALMQAQNVMQQRNALRGIDLSDPANHPAALSAAPDVAPGLLKSLGDYQQVASKSAFERSQARASDQKTAIEARMEDMRQIAALPDQQTAIQLLNSKVSSGGVPMVAAQAYQRMIEKDPNWKLNLMLSALDPTKASELLKPHLGVADLQNVMQPYSQDQISGKVTLSGAPMPIGQSANNAATVSASLANASALRDQAQATRDAANIQTGFANEQGLRKEFEGLPEIKNYKQAYPAFAAIKDAAARSTPQSDINLVYGIAKLYDPNSVVREGEYATVANSPAIPERIKGYAQYLSGGGKLSPETKKQILAEATSRLGTYEAEAKKARGSYDGIAKKRGMDPSSVFSDMGNMVGGNPAGAAQKVVNFADLK